jgi:hypothetical protein
MVEREFYTFCYFPVVRQAIYASNFKDGMRVEARYVKRKELVQVRVCV